MSQHRDFAISNNATKRTNQARSLSSQAFVDDYVSVKSKQTV